MILNSHNPNISEIIILKAFLTEKIVSIANEKNTISYNESMLCDENDDDQGSDGLTLWEWSMTCVWCATVCSICVYTLSLIEITYSWNSKHNGTNNI